MAIAPGYRRFDCRIELMAAPPRFPDRSRRSRHGARDALGTAYTQIATCAGLLAPDRAAAARACPGKGDRDLRLQRHGAGSGAAAARRPPGQHRYPQRHRHRRHHALARALRARGRPTARWRKDRRWWSAAARSATRSRRSPAGTRWYHSHDVAGTDLTRSLYSGMYGFLIVEPANDPGRYDQEVLLAAHHWEGALGQHAGHPQRSAARQRP